LISIRILLPFVTLEKSWYLSPTESPALLHYAVAGNAASSNGTAVERFAAG